MHSIRALVTAGLLAAAASSAGADPVDPGEAPASAPRPFPVCSNYREVVAQAGFPREAVAQNLAQGSALIEFTITSDGRVTGVRAVESSHPVFAQAAMGMVRNFQCSGVGRDIRVRVPFGFRLEDRRRPAAPP